MSAPVFAENKNCKSQNLVLRVGNTNFEAIIYESFKKKSRFQNLKIENSTMAHRTSQKCPFRNRWQQTSCNIYFRMIELHLTLKIKLTRLIWNFFYVNLKLNVLNFLKNNFDWFVFALPIWRGQFHDVCGDGAGHHDGENALHFCIRKNYWPGIITIIICCDLW